jgi:N-acetylneuraminate synthase
MDNKCKVVAEAGCNHQGEFYKAVEMIKMAKLCGADYIKFQKRNPEKAVPIEIQDKPHPCPMHSFGQTYLEHRQNLEFNAKQHQELKRICEDIGIGYSCSVWDLDSAREIISLEPDFIKIPSAMNENYELINMVFKEYDGDIHFSLGMLSRSDKTEVIGYLQDKGERVVPYWTTSGYPVRFEELYLSEIENLSNRFVRVGYSGHHLGIAVDIAAYCLGATWIERHFTLDRTAKGTDQSASIEPAGLQKLCRDLKATNKALRWKEVDYTEDELNNKNKLKIVKKC